MTDQQRALAALPDDIRDDAELTTVVALALGVNGSDGLAAAATLVAAAHRRREASNG